MRINATFIGRTSLGFETGNTYEIKVRQTGSSTGREYLIQVETVETMLVGSAVTRKYTSSSRDRVGRCLYSNCRKFMENWKLNTFRDCTVGWNLDDYEFEKHTILSQMRDSKLKILI